jgi:hypothetical protein
MITKSLKLDDSIVEKIELAAKSLNKKTGADVFDFSNVVRIAINQYLSSAQVKEMIAIYEVKRTGDKEELLDASQSSLAKDWFKPEEDEAWADL